MYVCGGVASLKITRLKAIKKGTPSPTFSSLPFYLPLYPLTMAKLDMSVSSQQLHLMDMIYSILDKTGLVLPTLFFLTFALAFIYHDRLIFTKPNRPGMVAPPGAYPLIGHTYSIVKAGTKNQFERFQEMAMGELSITW